MQLNRDSLWQLNNGLLVGEEPHPKVLVESRPASNQIRIGIANRQGIGSKHLCTRQCSGSLYGSMKGIFLGSLRHINGYWER